MSRLILPKRRLIVPALTAGLLAAPAIILSPKLVEALQIAGIAKPSRFIDIGALPAKQQAAVRQALMFASKMSGLQGGGAAPKALTYINRYYITTNTTTYTFSSCDLGVAYDDRRIIVGAHMYGSTGRTLTSATINGVSATELTTDSINTANTVLIIAHVPSGATGDIVLTWSAGCAGSAVTVWHAAGLTSDTPVDASRASGTTPTSTSALTTIAGGFIVAAATCRYNSGVTRTHSWTNGTEVLDLEFENTGSDGISISAAYVNPTDGSSVALTDTLNTTGAVVVCAASF